MTNVSRWNGAVILPVRGICCALAAGCTVIIKASEMCPWTHQIILEVFEEAGLPAGVLNQVQASRDKASEVTEALISHPAIRKVEFIGSANVGRIVAQVAAKHLKPVVMELGDQSPVIVCADADLEKAANSVMWSCTLRYNGFYSANDIDNSEQFARTDMLRDRAYICSQQYRSTIQPSVKESRREFPVWRRRRLYNQLQER